MGDWWPRPAPPGMHGSPRSLHLWQQPEEREASVRQRAGPLGDGGRPCRGPTFPLHAHGQALLVAAVLAPVPLPLVDQTVLVVPAGIGQVLAHCPLEEALTALTAVHPVVLACGRAQQGMSEWLRPPPTTSHLEGRPSLSTDSCLQTLAFRLGRSGPGGTEGEAQAPAKCPSCPCLPWRPRDSRAAFHWGHRARCYDARGPWPRAQSREGPSTLPPGCHLLSSSLPAHHGLPAYCLPDINTLTRPT